MKNSCAHCGQKHGKLAKHGNGCVWCGKEMPDCAFCGKQLAPDMNTGKYHLTCYTAKMVMDKYPELAMAYLRTIK